MTSGSGCMQELILVWKRWIVKMSSTWMISQEGLRS